MTDEQTAGNDAPGRVRRFLLWVEPWIAREQRRRDIRCWHRGHKGNPCRRCGRDIPPGVGNPAQPQA